MYGDVWRVRYGGFGLSKIAQVWWLAQNFLQVLLGDFLICEQAQHLWALRRQPKAVCYKGSTWIISFFVPHVSGIISSGSGGTWLVAMLLWASKSVVGNCLKHVLAHGAPKTLFYNGSSVDVFPEVSNASLGAKQRSMLIWLGIDMSSFEKGLPYQTLQADTIWYLPSKSSGGAWWRSARKPFLVAAFDRSLILITLPVLEILAQKKKTIRPSKWPVFEFEDNFFLFIPVYTGLGLLPIIVTRGHHFCY